MTGSPTPHRASPATRRPSGVAILGAAPSPRPRTCRPTQQYGVGVAGVWSRTPATHRGRSASGSRSSARSTPAPRSCSPTLRSAYVDIATGPEGRLRLDRGRRRGGQARPGPEAADAVDAADLAALPGRARAGRRGRRPGRGQPQRPVGARLAGGDAAVRRRRRSGEVVGVTHLHDKPLPPLAGTPFDDVPHMLLTDYLLHWVDITRSWLAGRRRGSGDVGAGGRLPGAGPAGDARNPWSATLSLATVVRRDAPTLRIVGNVASDARLPVLGARHRRAPCAAACCWTPTGSSSTTGRAAPPVALTGAWFVDGFAGRDGRADVRGRRGPRARELRRATPRARSAGPRRPRVRRAAAASPVAGRGRAADDDAPGRRRGAGRPGDRPGLRRGLAELEPGHLVPGHRREAAARPRSGST